jgi:eukaryotic translation initiation factor 2C
MFPRSATKDQKNRNVDAGTLIENHPTHNDMFLTAHQGMLGTSRPTRYITIQDDNSLSANDFQRITNNLCSGYARATCAVSLVPAVYYADQACTRARIRLIAGREIGDGVSPATLHDVHPSLKFTSWWL